MTTEILRVATLERTWPNGETSTHYWVEVELDSWLEVNRLPDTYEDLWVFRKQHAHGGMFIPGKTYPLTAHTRFLRQFSDKLEMEAR